MDQLSPSFPIETLEEIVRNCQRNEQRLHELKQHTRHERKKAERLLRETYRIKQEQLTTQNENRKPKQQKQQPIEFFISLDDDNNNNNSYPPRRENKIQRVRFNIPEKFEPKKSNIDDELDNLARRCENLLTRLTINQSQAEALPNLENDQSITLQQALESYRPNFISHSQQRVQHINDLRGEREYQTSKPIQVQSSYQEMKQTAKKKYNQLPEVTNRLHQELINEMKQKNYLRAKLFRTRLQRHVLLHGQTNIDSSLTMIDT